MNTLTGFELRKLISRKSTLIGLIGFLVVSLLSTVVPAFQEDSYEASGTVKGFAAIALEKSYARSFQGELTPAVFSQTASTYQKILNELVNPNEETGMGAGSGISNEDFYKVYSLSPVLNYLRKGFSPAGEYNYDVVDTLTPEKAATFYDQRTGTIQQVLNHPPDGVSYSEDAKATFLRMNDQITIPMKFDYSRGWSLLLQNSGFFFLTVCFILSVFTAPVFSGEYQSGADAIILATRYGRSKLIRAKINASLLFTSGMFLLAWLMALALSMIVYGASGWNSPLQTIDTRYLFSPYPVTVLGAFLLTTLIGWLACLAIVSFTLLLSSRMRTPFSVMIWSIVLLFVPLFIPESRENRLFNHLLALLPGRQTEVYSRFRGYDLLEVVGLNVPLPYAIGWTAFLITIVLLPFAWRGFRKHEVA